MCTYFLSNNLQRILQDYVLLKFNYAEDSEKPAIAI